MKPLSELIFAVRDRARVAALVETAQNPGQPCTPQQTAEWQLAEAVEGLLIKIKNLEFEVNRERTFKEAFEKKWVQAERRIEKLLTKDTVSI